MGLTGAGIATYVSLTDGNVGTAGTWANVESTSFLDSVTDGIESSGSGNVTVTTSAQNSTAFTPGAVTIDAIAVKFVNPVASPSGTFTIRLAQGGTAVTGTTVTCNAADVPRMGWMLFKFGASVTLTAATAYTIQVLSSVASQFTLMGTNTSVLNIARILRLTTSPGSAPQAASGQNDNLYVMGECTGAGAVTTRTLTWDQTGSSFGFNQLSIGGKAIVNVQNSASTNYFIIVNNHLKLFANSQLNIGTSGTPIVSTSTVTLIFNSAATPSSGGFGLYCYEGTFNSYGVTKGTVWTTLAADVAAAATSFTVTAATDWASGDLVAFAPTSITSTQFESRTLNSVSGTTIGISAGLTNAHSGTGDYIGEVGNLTRNVLIRGTAATTEGFLYFAQNCQVTLRYTEFKWFGNGGITPFYGIYVNFINSTVASKFDMQFCSYHDSANNNAYGVYFNTVSSALGHTLTVSSNVFYNTANAQVFITANTTAAITIDSNLFIGMSSTLSTGMIDVACLTATVTNNNIAGVTTSGNTFGGITLRTGGTYTGTISGNTVHSTAGVGFNIRGTTTNIITSYLISTFTAWRNNYGILVTVPIASSVIQFSTLKCYANSTAGLSFLESFNGIFYIDTSSVFKGGTSPTQPAAIESNPGGVNLNVGIFKIVVNDSDLGSLSAHGVADVYLAQTGMITLLCNNCKFGSTEVSGNNNNKTDGFVASNRHQQTDGNYKSWPVFGVLSRDTTIFSTASPSQRYTPNSGTNKLTAGNFRVNVPAGATPTVSIKVRCSATGSGDSATYNGNRPRFWLQSDSAAGIANNTLLATSTSASNGAWETLTATLPSFTGNAIANCYIDCDGTAGWVNVDDFSCSETSADSGGMVFYQTGQATCLMGNGGGVGGLTQTIIPLPLPRKKVV